MELSYKNILEVCNVYQPKTIATKNFIPDGKYIVYGANGEIGRYNDYNHEESEILMACRGATCGAINVSKPYSWINGNAMVIQPNGIVPIDKKYLQYFLMSIDKNKLITGTAQPQITRHNMSDFKIGLCEIEVQKCIVNRIEELFSELDKAEDTLLKTKAQLDVYKQAVLKDAFEHNEEWQQYKFVELMESIKNGYGIKPTDDGEYPIFKISAVRPMHIVLSEIRYNKEPFEEAFLVHENDILVTRYNGSKEFVGCCGVVSNIKGSIGYPDKLIRCRPKINNKWHSKFIQYYLSQGEARKFIRSKIKTTSGQNGLAGGDLKKVTVKLPDLNVQKAIVENIEDKLIAFENIENTTNIILLKVKSLRQSILKEAFEGKLV